MKDTIEMTYWTIGEVAMIAGVATSAIRFWGDRFEWTKPKKNKIGHRQYNRESANDTLDALYLIDCGMTEYGVLRAKKQGFLKDLVRFYMTFSDKYRPEMIDTREELQEKRRI